MSKTKKHSALIILMTTVLIVVLGVWGYNSYIRQIYLNNVNQTETIDLESDLKFEFGKHKDQGEVYGIEIEVSGQSDSNFDLIISDGVQDRNVASVKGKDIDFTYINEWHSDSCILTVVPRNKIGGRVTVDCRFLALE